MFRLYFKLTVDDKAVLAGQRVHQQSMTTSSKLHVHSSSMYLAPSLVIQIAIRVKRELLLVIYDYILVDTRPPVSRGNFFSGRKRPKGV